MSPYLSRKKSHKIYISTILFSVILDEASVSQAISKKDTRQEAKGNNNTKDIRIENFDVSYKERVLIHGANLTLAYGRRYGLVGRNGLGKTTLLRALSRYGSVKT